MFSRRGFFSLPSGDPADFEGLSEADQEAMRVLQWFYENKFSFNVLPASSRRRSRSDCWPGTASCSTRTLDRDFILANVAICWLTGASGSAIRFYYEDAHVGDRPAGPTTTPTGLAMFAGHFQSIRRVAERDHSAIVSWHSYDPPGRAGHYAAHLAPDLLVADLRQFFGGLR